MRKRKRAAIWVVFLSVICGLVIWHVVYWHSTGMYLEMVSWLESGKGYLIVLYNLALMMVTGALLGILMEKVTELIGYKAGDTKH